MSTIGEFFLILEGILLQPRKENPENLHTSLFSAGGRLLGNPDLDQKLKGFPGIAEQISGGLDGSPRQSRIFRIASAGHGNPRHNPGTLSHWKVVKLEEGLSAAQNRHLRGQECRNPPLKK